MLTPSVIDMEGLIDLVQRSQNKDDLQSLSSLKSLLKHLAQKAIVVYSGAGFETSEYSRILAVLPEGIKKQYQSILLHTPRVRASTANWDGRINNTNYPELTDRPSLIALSDKKCNVDFDFKFDQFTKEVTPHEIVRLTHVEHSSLVEKNRALAEKPVTRLEGREDVWKQRFEPILSCENIIRVSYFDRYLFEQAAAYIEGKSVSDDCSLSYLIRKICQSSSHKRIITLATLPPDLKKWGPRMLRQILDKLQVIVTSFPNKRISIQLYILNPAKISSTDRHDRFMLAGTKDMLSCAWSLGKGVYFFEPTANGRIREETDFAFKNHPDALKSIRQRLNRLLDIKRNHYEFSS